MGEIACGFCIKELVLYTKRIKQFGKYDTAHAVDGVNAHLEMGCLDGIDIDKLQREHAVYMTFVESVVFAIMTKIVYICIFECLTLCNVKNLVAISLCKKLALAVEQFQSIPLTWIVACCDDDATVGTAPANSQFCCGRCGETDIYNIEAHTHERSAHHVFNHLARDAGITTNNNFIALACFADESGISRRELYNVKRIEGVTCGTAYCSADSRNRFD